MLDLHTHILPGIDDGSRNIETSVSMLNECRKQGVKDVFFTPHFYPEQMRMESFLTRREAAWEKLLKVFDFKAAGIRPHLGAEVHYFSGISRSNEIRKLKLDETDCILLELPSHRGWPDGILEDTEAIRQVLGLQVIIAHAERYVPPLHRYRTLFDALLEHGAYIQVNTDFFIEKRSQKKALTLLKEGKIQFIGSDAHDLSVRRPDIKAAADIIRTDLGAKYLNDFFKKAYGILGEK